MQVELAYRRPFRDGIQLYEKYKKVQSETYTFLYFKKGHLYPFTKRIKMPQGMPNLAAISNTFLSPVGKNSAVKLGRSPGSRIVIHLLTFPIIQSVVTLAMTPLLQWRDRAGITPDFPFKLQFVQLKHLIPHYSISKHYFQ